MMRPYHSYLITLCLSVPLVRAFKTSNAITGANLATKSSSFPISTSKTTFLPTLKSPILSNFHAAATETNEIDNLQGEYESLIKEIDNPHPPVKKKIIVPSPTENESMQPTPNSKVTISYVTTLATENDINWNEFDVVNCFLKEQQGLYESLSSSFIEQRITLEKMLDVENFFTDEFIQGATNSEKGGLGVENKIQAKKLAMAVRRLKTTRDEYSAKIDGNDPLILDSNEEFSFVLGAGKVIQAMDKLVGTMRKGEKTKMVCRADFGYGKEGLRKRNGDILVPSFADLCFEIELLDYE